MNKLRFLAYSILVAFVGYGVWIGVSDGQRIYAAVTQVGFSGLIFLCGLSLCNYLLRYLRWRYFLRVLGDVPDFVDGLYCYCAGFALATTPGKAGEAIRCWYFRERHGVEHAHSLAALLADRLTDLVAAVFLAAAALYYFEHFRWMSWAVPSVCLLVLLAVLYPAPWLYCSQHLARYVPARLKPFFIAAPLFFERANALFKPQVLCVGVLLGFISWSAEAWGFAWLAHQLGNTGHVAILMGVFSLAMIAGVVVPGGLGGTEAAMAMLLMALGMGGSEALVVTILCRLATLWLSIALGVCAMLWLAQRPFAVSQQNAGKHT
ncbi:MAG: flippase-like domain-containing protein [Pseudomonadales bacterium]|nr:flippase-like domain-containing protein [Pseudomonadales bacterium]